MRPRAATTLLTLLPALGAADNAAPVSPSATTATVRFVYRAATAPRPDLSPSQRPCADAVGRTHIHPGWRAFERIEMNTVRVDRWEIAFSDVPVNVRQSIRVSDGNVCDENATGAATPNVFANDVLLVEIVPTPGAGTEPGLAFTVSAEGRVTP